MNGKEVIRVPVITGPTASGKTSLAIEIAVELGWDIISCDSRQVYRGMNIGTAKSTSEEQMKVKQWLIDIIDPSEAYSVYRFSTDAAEIITKLHNQNRLAMICGGTGLYLRGLIEGVGPQEESEPTVRDELTTKAGRIGSEAMHRELQEKDPVSAQKIHPRDLQRIIRALAVYYQSGIPISELQKSYQKDSKFEFVVIKTKVDRPLLYERINSRVDAMVKGGLYDEFRKLVSMGYDEMSPGMHCVGYKEFFAVERKEYSFADAVELIKRNTRRFAKRQITWFTHQQFGTEIDLTEGVEKGREELKKFFLDNTTC